MHTLRGLMAWRLSHLCKAVMTDEELASIRARHQHDHAEDGGVACPWCEQDVPALLAEVERLRSALGLALGLLDRAGRTEHRWHPFTAQMLDDLDRAREAFYGS